MSEQTVRLVLVVAVLVAGVVGFLLGSRSMCDTPPSGDVQAHAAWYHACDGAG